LLVVFLEPEPFLEGASPFLEADFFKAAPLDEVAFALLVPLAAAELLDVEFLAVKLFVAVLLGLTDFLEADVPLEVDAFLEADVPLEVDALLEDVPLEVDAFLEDVPLEVDALLEDVIPEVEVLPGLLEGFCVAFFTASFALSSLSTVLLPLFLAEAVEVVLPRPEPLFLPPPEFLLTVAQARFSASFSSKPR
jgi:hypothetical protein